MTRFFIVSGLALAFLASCDAGATKPQITGAGGSMAGGSGGNGGSGGATAGGGGAGTGGSTPMTGTGGNVDAAVADDSGGSIADAGGEIGPSPDAPPVTGWGGVPGVEDLSTVKPAAGCGQDPGQALGNWVAHTITTPMTRLGSIVRTYHVKLPTDYDRTKSYRLVYEGTSCGGGPTDVPDFAALAGADGVIQIALQRRDGVHTDGAGGPSCFDNWSTMSIEYPFFEAVHAAVNKTLCFDQHRVFAAGHSSGAWIANYFGCNYGSTFVRAISPHAGGFSQDPNPPVYGAPPTGPPTCRDLPTPGFWQHNHDDGNNPITGNIRAITRALKANRCTETDFATAKRAPYPAPGSNGACNQFTGCPKEFPIVFCDPQTGGHAGNQMWAGAWQFFKSF
ncbi:MAG TPA: hypothetical protein VFH73_21460 [Polyangia bacterium]|nr:hypothetical protein [Polyangia bacterium]